MSFMDKMKNAATAVGEVAVAYSEMKRVEDTLVSEICRRSYENIDHVEARKVVRVLLRDADGINWK